MRPEKPFALSKSVIKSPFLELEKKCFVVGASEKAAVLILSNFNFQGFQHGGSPSAKTIYGIKQMLVLVQILRYRWFPL